MMTGPAKGAVGGAAGEGGSDFRAAVGAWIVVHALVERPLDGIGQEGTSIIPNGVVLPESDAPVDDLEVHLVGGGRLYLQAKRSLALSSSEESELGKTMAQCRALLNTSGFDAGRDRIVLVVGESTGPLRALRSALARVRAPKSGNPSDTEKESLNVLRGHLSSLSGGQVEQLLKALDLLILDVNEPGSGPRERAEAWLDGKVVVNGTAAIAWGIVESRIKKLGVKRLGAGIEEWLGWLRQGGATLIADARGSRAARIEATWLARKRYADRLRTRASQLDLDFLFPGLPPLQVDPDPGDIEVTVNGKEDKQRLDWAQRRRGRVLLLGIPGMGKSTAIRRLGAWLATIEEGPFPLCVHLPHLLTDGRQGSNLIERLVHVTLQSEPQEDRELLRSYSLERLRKDGRAILLLDSLDECRSQAPAVVAWIRNALQEVHPDVEVVLATRDSAYASARSLLVGEPLLSPEVLRLEPPSEHDLEKLLEKAARHVATASGKMDVDQQVKTHLAWVKKQRAHDALRAPLLAWTLLSLGLAGQHEPDLGRGQLLSHVVEESTRRWEVLQRRQGAFRMAHSVEGHEAQGVLLFAFDCLGFALVEVESLTVREIESRLVAALQEAWNFPLGTAKAAATEARHFWDEAGIFVAEGADQRVRSRLRLFAEIGAARCLRDWSNSEQQSWIRMSLGHPENEEVLILLAALSPVAAATLADTAMSLGGRRELLLVARAVCEGIPLNIAQIERIARALLTLVEKPAGEDWEVVETLLELPVTVPLVGDIEARVATIFAPQHARTVHALGWMKRHPEEMLPDDMLLPLLAQDSVHPPPAEKPPLGIKERLLTDLRPDKLYGRAIREVAKRLPPEHPDLVLRILSAPISWGQMTELHHILRERGYDKEVAESIKKIAGSATELLRRHLKESDEFFRQILQCLSERAEPMAPWRERRRLDHLCQFVRTLIDPELPAYFFSVATGQNASLTSNLAFLVIKLGGFELGLLGAQAASIDPVQDQVSLRHDAYSLEAVPLSHWPSGDEAEQLLEQVLKIFGPHPWPLNIATQALLGHPDPSRYLPHLESMALSPGYGGERRSAAFLVLYHEADPLPRLREWGSSIDSFLQKVSASFCASLYKEGKLNQNDILLFLHHSDGAVRAVILERLAGTVPVNLSTLPPPQSWSCHGCGTSYAASAETCPTCDLVRPTCLPWFPSLPGTHQSF